MLHPHLGPFHVLINSVNFGREVKSLTSSGREFQILGPKDVIQKNQIAK